MILALTKGVKPDAPKNKDLPVGSCCDSGQTAVISAPDIERCILVLRGRRVMVDADLARLYGVTTKRLNEQVKRNSKRFPADFMFQLTPEEKDEVVAICDHLKNVRFYKGLPYAFTEHGAIMLANVLRSERAMEMSVYVVRAFIRLRETMAQNMVLERKVVDIERIVAAHDRSIRSLIAAIHQMREPPKKKQRRIGFDLERKT